MPRGLMFSTFPVLAIVLRILLVFSLLDDEALRVVADNVMVNGMNDTAPEVAYMELWPRDMWTVDGNGNSSFNPSAQNPSESCPAVRILFNGTAITVYGGKSGLPTWGSVNITLDGQHMQQSDNTSSGQSVLFATSNIPDQSYQHILVITLHPCLPPSPPGESLMYLLYAEITPSPPEESSNSTVFSSYSFNALNDSSLPTGAIDWFGPPTPTQVSDNIPLQIESSSKVWMTITFLGTGIQAYTYYDKSAPLSPANVTVDGSYFSTSPGDPDAAVANDNKPILLAEVSGLHSGWHVLDLTTENGTQNRPTWLTFSFVNITGTSNVSSSSLGSGAASSSSAIPASSPSVVTSTSKNDLQTHNRNTGAIAGGVVGGVAFLAILAALLFFFLRKRNAHSASAQHDRNPSESMLMMAQADPEWVGKGKGKGRGRTNSSDSAQVLTGRSTPLPDLAAAAAIMRAADPPPRQLRAQRAGLGPMLEEKIRDRDALEANFGANPPLTGTTLGSAATPSGRFEHVPDWRDAEIDRLRSDLGGLHTALHERHASLDGTTAMGAVVGGGAAGGGDELPGYQGGDFDGPLRIDEKVRERDAVEDGIGGAAPSREISPSASSTHRPQRSVPDWRDDELKRLRAEVAQMHTALGMVDDQ